MGNKKNVFLSKVLVLSFGITTGAPCGLKSGRALC